MNKYIGENRLTYLWGKTKAFVSNAISGKVDKVSSSTDNAVVRFDGASGGIQNSGVTINDSNHLTAPKFITSGGTSSQFVKGDGSLDSNTYTPQTNTGANSLIGTLPTWTATPTDGTYLIRRDTSGAASFGQVTFATVWAYIASKISSVLGIGGSNGTPTAPTAASGTNTTQIATTAFVQSAVDDLSATLTDGTAASESGNVIDVAEYDLMKINEVKGKSWVWNQLVPQTLAMNYFRCTAAKISDGHYKFTNNSSGSLDNVSMNMVVTTLANHVHYISFDAKTQGTGFSIYLLDSGTGRVAKSVTANTWQHLSCRIKNVTNGSRLYVYFDAVLSIESEIKNVQIFDLTQMFGAGNEPTTVEEVEAILGNEYYEYNTGEVVGNSVEKLDVTGFNMLRLTGRTEYSTGKTPTDKWDFLSEDVVIKGMSYNAYLSSYTINSYSISKESVTVKTSTAGNAALYGLGLPVKVLPNISYYFKTDLTSGAYIGLSWFDNDGYFISYQASVNNTTFTSPANAHWCVIIFRPNAVDTEGTFTNPVFNISNTTKNGTYEPYKHSEFPLNLTELTGKVDGEGTSETIFSGGLHGVGNVFDSLIVDDDGYARRAVKRMWSRAYASGDESDTSVITDNTNTYYPLATPIEYMLDTPVQCVAKVYPNGTVKQVPVMPDSTPMVMDVTYLHDTGGVIGGLIGNYATKEYVYDVVGDIETLLASI